MLETLLEVTVDLILEELLEETVAWLLLENGLVHGTLEWTLLGVTVDLILEELLVGTMLDEAVVLMIDELLIRAVE